MSIIPTNSYPTITTLKNGIRVATMHVESELSTIGIWVKSGSIYETQENSGVAHFLEHIIFRGNDKYPKDRLEELADINGINLMAHTSRTVTAFYAQVESRHLAQAADVIASTVNSPKFDPRDVENERPTILEEEYEVSHDFNETLWDCLHKVSFSESSVGFPILGNKKTIGSITHEQIKKCHSTFFNPSNEIFVCVSKLPHEQIVESIEKATEFIKKRPPLDIETLDKQMKCDFTAKVQLFGAPTLYESWCSLGIGAPPMSSPLFAPCQLVRCAIGDEERIKTLEKPALLKSDAVSRLQTIYMPYNKTGLLGFLGNCSFGREQEWMDTIMNALRATTVEIKQDDLKMAKLRFIDMLIKNLSSSRSIADEVGQQILLAKKYKSIDDWKRIAENVTAQDMAKFAFEYINEKPFAGAFIVPAQPGQNQQANKA